jgi:hypothetical protein
MTKVILGTGFACFSLDYCMKTSSCFVVFLFLNSPVLGGMSIDMKFHIDIGDDHSILNSFIGVEQL